MTPKTDILAVIPAKSHADATTGETLSRLVPPRGDVSTVVMACPPADFSASRIAHAVEDCDAHLLNLNVTAEVTAAGEAVVELRVSRLDPTAVVRSLERYGYNVLAAYPADDADHDGRPDINDADRARALEALYYINLNNPEP